jgi:anti-anti-sigma factor
MWACALQGTVGAPDARGVRMDVQPHSVQGADCVRVDMLSPALAMVSLIGSHDLGCSQALRDAFASVAECPDVVVDLTHCSFIDSTAIHIFVLANAVTHTHGGCFTLVVPPQQIAVARVVELTRLGDLVAVHSSHQSALASALASLEHSEAVAQARA